MKILLVAHGFPPAAMGGTEIYTHDLGRSLVEHFGDEVFVLSREVDPARPEYSVRRDTRHGMQVFFVNNSFAACTSFEDTYRSPRIRAIAARLLDEIEPEVAHLQHLTCLSTELVFELAARGVPTLFTLNDYWLICHRGQLMNMAMQRCGGPREGCESCIRGEAGVSRSGYRAALLVRSLERSLPGTLGRSVGRSARAVASRVGSARRAGDAGRRRAAHMLAVASTVDQLLAPSNTLQRHFLDFGVPPSKIRRIEQGIEQDRFQGLQRRPHDGPLRIGFLGSMIVTKAPHLLLEAFAGLPPGTASLEIYGGFGAYHGDDSYRARVEPLLGAPGVHHHGSIPHAQVPQAFANMDVMVIPSIWLENAPFVIREASVAGVPVVTSDLGGMAEMVEHEVSGLRFKVGDAADLRRTLQRLIDEPELLPHLRLGLRRMMTIEEDAAQLRELYTGVRAARAGGRRRRLAAVVLNYRTPRDTVLAVRSLQSSTRPPDHLIVVDNGSGDDSLAILEQSLHDVELIATGSNLGFSGGTNVGIRRALEDGADGVFLLNGDAMVAAPTLARLDAALAADPEIGQAAPVVLHRADPARMASAGMFFNRVTGRMRHPEADQPYTPADPPPTHEVASASGCATLLSRAALEAAGLLDEDYFFTFEDLAWGLTARRRGFRSVVVGDAVAYHAGSLSIGPDSPARLYYATRNHLLAARRGAPLPWLLAVGRGKLIVALNAAHALLFPGVSARRGLAEVLRGTLDHIRGRYGAREGS